MYDEDDIYIGEGLDKRQVKTERFIRVVGSIVYVSGLLSLITLSLYNLLRL